MKMKKRIHHTIFLLLVAIFSDITGLMQSIRNGDKENAAKLASLLATKRIRLQSSENAVNVGETPIS